MTLRSGHGRGKGQPRVEVLPADELPVGTPAPARPAPARDDAGRFLPSAGTTALAREGARAAHEARQLGQLLGLRDVAETHAYAPYARLARSWRDDHVARLAATVGAGEVGPAPASIVSTAALQLAASRWLYDEAVKDGSAKALLDASKLADASRQNLLAAHELCAREAKARKAVGGRLDVPPFQLVEPDPNPGRPPRGGDRGPAQKFRDHSGETPSSTTATSPAPVEAEDVSDLIAQLTDNPPLQPGETS